MTAEADVLAQLTQAHQSVAAAESLTGGALSSRLVSVPGASVAFRGAVVAYDPEVKQSMLGVPAGLLAEHGTVSAACAEAMADGVRRALGATWGIATTGVAGPDPSEGKAVGTVWVAVAGADGVCSRGLHAEGDRAQVREQAVDACLALFADVLSGEQTPLG